MTEEVSEVGSLVSFHDEIPGFPPMLASQTVRENNQKRIAELEGALAIAHETLADQIALNHGLENALQDAQNNYHEAMTRRGELLLRVRTLQDICRKLHDEKEQLLLGSKEPSEKWSVSQLWRVCVSGRRFADIVVVLLHLMIPCLYFLLLVVLVYDWASLHSGGY